MICNRCKKREAAVFITTLNEKGQYNEGLCLVCARDLGVPQVADYMRSLGITDDMLDDFSPMAALYGGDVDDGGNDDKNNDDDDGGDSGVFPALQNGFSGVFPGGAFIGGTMPVPPGINVSDIMEGISNAVNASRNDNDDDEIEILGDGDNDDDDDGDENIAAFSPGGAATLPSFIRNMFKNLNMQGAKIEISSNGIVNPEEQGKQKDDIRDSKNAGTENSDKKTKKQKDKKHKFLDTFCNNLTEKARDGKLDRIVGRDKEIDRVVQILSRRTKNNPCLIGEPGVGKTAVAEGIAQRLVSGEVPFRLKRKELYLLDMTVLIAGTQFRGQFEQRVKSLVDEVRRAGDVILFIDEVHTLVGTDGGEGSMNAANMFKPALARGDMQIIGATTYGEYRKYIEKDGALERRFQPVTINEPTIDEAFELLKGIRTYYEEHHKVKVADSVLKSCVVLSERYISDRFLPDKAIDLLDESAACVSIESKSLSEYEHLKEITEQLEKEEDDALNVTAKDNVTEEEKNNAYARHYEIKSRVEQNKVKLAELENEISGLHITEKDLGRVIELWTGIPASKITENEYSKIDGLETALKKKIIGQDEACELTAAAVRRTRVQLTARRRPASFIFVGPTGVGKTELVKVLSKEMFDTVEPLIRLDMSEFMEKHSVSRIVGSPPGYVGYDEAGQLTEKVRRRPYSVILFDEIEKAHPDVMNILLQILDEGKINDSHGRSVNFEHTIIAMTSNAGSGDKSTGLGFGKTANDISREKTEKALKDFLRPEFMSRIDEIVIFKPLGRAAYVKIAELMLGEMKEPLYEKDITLEIEPAVYEYLADKVTAGENKFGGRDLRKLLRKEVEDPLSSLIVSKGENGVSGIVISAEENDTASDGKNRKYAKLRVSEKTEV